MKKQKPTIFKKSRRPTNEELMAKETLGEYFMWWNPVTQAVWREFKGILDSASNEYEIQHYLESHREILVHVVGGGHGRWVAPQFKLGSEYVADFIVGEKHSFGYDWLLVELESPKAILFNKKGDPSKTLNHAIRQVSDWRAWISNNIDYCRRAVTANGLGLFNIRSEVPALILLGREPFDPKTNELRRQLSIQNNIRIHSYDYLLHAGSGTDVFREIENENVT